MPGGSSQFASIEVLVAGLTDVKLSIVFEFHCEKVCRKDKVNWKRISRIGRLL